MEVSVFVKEKRGSKSEMQGRRNDQESWNKDNPEGS